MKKILSSMALLSFFLLSVNAVHAAGIVFNFGSNTTTERRAAFEAAASEIEQMIDFKQNVKVSVEFINLACDASGVVLGSAGPLSAFRDFTGAPQSNTWYTAAQAADFGDSDAISQPAHIGAQFNHQLGSVNCLPSVSWYFGTDHNPGLNQIDFLSTAVHELMHGLGFLSFAGSNGALFDNRMDNYSSFLFNNSTSKSWKIMTDNERAASILSNGNLVWSGAKTTSMNSLLQASSKTGGKVRLFAPSTYEQGSSTSHFDTAVHYNSGTDEVMEPYDSFPQSSIMATAAFCDMGWDLLRDTDGDTVNDCDDAFPNNSAETNDTDGDGVGNNADAFPNDPTETADADNDGVGDNADVFPNDPTETADTDNDGVGNNADAFPNDPTETTDTDNDGVGDNTDAFPSNAAASVDTDNDGKPDVWHQPNLYSCAVNAPTCNGLTLDTDSDNDGVLDVTDNCPLVSNANQLDYDNDGTGNACGDDVPMPGITGAISADKTGSSVAFAGDFNDDDYGDYIVGIPGYDIPENSPKKVVKNAGRAVVISGKTGTVLMSVAGVAPNDAMGFAVAGGGDINDDGFDDVVVGAPKEDDFTNKRTDAGSVTVLYGRADINPVILPNQIFYGAAAKILSGSAVALGDVNNDGNADIIVGAPKADDLRDAEHKLIDAGSVTIIDGNTLVALPNIYYGSTPKAFAGTSVAVGNVDAVTGADIIIGAPNDDDVANKRKDTGSVTVYNIADASTPVIPKQYGAVLKAYLGKSVAAGNIDGLAGDEVLAGAPGDDTLATPSSKKIVDTGSITVFSGSNGTQLTKKYGATAKAGLGNSVTVGDVNGDGKADIIVGASKEDVPANGSIKKIVDAGSVSIFSGNGFGLIDTLYGETTKDYLGFALSAGDINSDGKADLIIGISGDDIPATKTIKDGGTVKIISGVTLL